MLSLHIWLALSLPIASQVVLEITPPATKSAQIVAGGTSGSATCDAPVFPDTLSAAVVRGERPVVPPADTLTMVPEVEIADAVREFTGLQVKDYGGTGGLKTINVRSLGSEFTGVYIDGIEVHNAQNMQVDLGRFSSSSFEKADLYSGGRTEALQSAAEYGAASALYLRSSAPGENGLKARLRGGSFGTAAPSVRWERLWGRGVSSRVEAEYLRSNGEYRFSLVPYGYDTTLVRKNGDIRSGRAEASVYGPGWNVKAYLYGSERGFPGPVVRRAEVFPLSADRQEDLDMFVQGQWHHAFPEGTRVALRGKYSRNHTRYNTHPELNPMAVPYDITYVQRNAYVSGAVNRSIGDFSFDVAADGQFAALEGNSSGFPEPDRLSFWTAGAVRYETRSVRASASLMYTGATDWFNLRDGSRFKTFRDALSPSVQASWTPSEGILVSGFVKRSWRMPSFNDLYYTLVGNSELLPESALQSNVSLSAERPLGPFRFDARASAYFNAVRNKILAIPSSSQFRWTMLNIGRADIYGAEIRAGAHYASGSFSASLTGRYTFQRALDHTPSKSGLNLSYGNQLPYIPVHSGSVSAVLSFAGWQADVIAVLTGPRYSRTANTADYLVPAWGTVDLRVKTPELGPVTLSVALGNLLNEQYSVVQGYPMPGRNVMVMSVFCF